MLPALSAIVFGVAACSTPAPVAIAYDSDTCDHCRMTISDAAFAGQVVLRTGKVLRFDDPGCLASSLADGTVTPSDVHSIWLNDHANPERRINSAEAVFVVSDRLRAPMNGGAAAFASRDAAAAFAETVGGRLETWTTIAARGRR